MERDFSMKRSKKELPPEKLYELLRHVCCKKEADEIFKRMTGNEPPKEET